MGFNFPNSPIEGATYTPVGGYQYVYTGGVWRVVESPQVRATAEARNRIVNPAFFITQENANNPGTVSNYYAADQWTSFHVTSAGVFTRLRRGLGAYTSKGSSYAFEVTITTPDAVLAAGEYLSIDQPIEGKRIQDFMWGYPTARQIVVRFGFRGPAGTYAMAITNGPSEARSYVAPFTISAGQANTEVEQVFVVPGDTAGTWPLDQNLGAYFYVVLAAGTTFQGVSGWQAGPKYATAAISNGMGTAGAVFQITDVGLYLDPDATGLAPKWAMPDEAQELTACQRYWNQYPNYLVEAVAANYTTTHTVQMRIVPAMTGGGAGFSVAVGNTNSFVLQQTTRGIHNIVANARM